MPAAPWPARLLVVPAMPIGPAVMPAGGGTLGVTGPRPAALVGGGVLVLPAAPTAGGVTVPVEPAAVGGRDPAVLIDGFIDDVGGPPVSGVAEQPALNTHSVIGTLATTPLHQVRNIASSANPARALSAISYTWVAVVNGYKFDFVDYSYNCVR